MTIESPSTQGAGESGASARSHPAGRYPATGTMVSLRSVEMLRYCDHVHDE